MNDPLGTPTKLFEIPKCLWVAKQSQANQYGNGPLRSPPPTYHPWRKAHPWHPPECLVVPENVWKGSNVTCLLLMQCFKFKVAYFLRTQSQCLQRCVDVPFSWWSCIATGHDLVIQWPTFSAKAKNARLGFGVSILGGTKHFWGEHLLPGTGWNDGLAREFHTVSIRVSTYIKGFGSGLIT